MTRTAENTPALGHRTLFDRFWRPVAQDQNPKITLDAENVVAWANLFFSTFLGREEFQYQVSLDDGCLTTENGGYLAQRVALPDLNYIRVTFGLLPLSRLEHRKALNRRLSSK